MRATCCTHKGGPPHPRRTNFETRRTQETADTRRCNVVIYHHWDLVATLRSWTALVMSNTRFDSCYELQTKFILFPRKARCQPPVAAKWGPVLTATARVDAAAAAAMVLHQTLHCVEPEVDDTPCESDHVQTQQAAR